MKVKEIIAEAQKNASSRKTKNAEMYNAMIKALCQDDEYISKHISIVNGEVVTKDLKLSEEFRKIIVKTLKKHTNISEAEAVAAAANFTLSTEDAKTIAAIVHEADYLIAKDCNKKVQLFKKPGFDISMTIEEVPERIRSNPRDPAKKVKTLKHDRVKIQQSLFAFQKKALK